jgi:hypothetical protein
VDKLALIIFIFISGCTYVPEANAFLAAIFVALGIEVSMAAAAAAIAASTALTVASYAITMVVSMAISFAVSSVIGGPNSPSSPSQRDPGNRTQIPPATSNKLPVVYGTSYIGGTVIDLSITDNDQTMYYVLALSEVTNTNPGQTPDTVSFGNVYFAGKKCVFDATKKYQVNALLDESTGESETNVKGKIKFYFYSNGSNTPTNSDQTAIQVMSNSKLAYQWDSTKLMTNCAFVIMVLTYSVTANIRGLAQTKFQVTNSRHKPGSCLYDYLINTRYGAAIPAAQIDTVSLDALDVYSDQAFTYTDYEGGTTTQTRFRFDGVADTQRAIMATLQDMTSSCDCLLRYNEITAQWGVIVQSPSYTVAMAINDSNVISGIQVTPIDLSNSFNIAEVKFPDKANQDTFNTSTFDLAQIDPALLFPNEPVNKQSVTVPFCNDDVRAQYLGNRFLKAAREDLQVTLSINYVGLQLSAGDIITLTNLNYGWVDKLFRTNKVTQTFKDDGSIVVNLLLMEFNPTVYDDVSITQFQPSPNTGIGDPLVFGTVPPPVVDSSYPTDVNPLFLVKVTTPAAGISQYAELYYTAFASPTEAQLIFAGTSEVQANGTPWNTNTVLPLISLAGIPSGDWYFVTRMMNSLGASSFSLPSAVFKWRPTTFQYTEQYLVVAYADTITGGGFNLNPRGKFYYGLLNQNNETPSTNPDDYSWYLAEPTFGTVFFLCYQNRTGRKASFDTGAAAYASGTASFVPSDTLVFDPTIWGALPDGTNHIDLDYRTGQLLKVASTVTGTNSGEVVYANNDAGLVTLNLSPFLRGTPYFPIGSGNNLYTSAVATLTVDVYGRVVGFTTPDSFEMTISTFTATSGQTFFAVTRNAAYIPGECLVFNQGTLCQTSEYTDAAGGVTFGTGRVLNNIITVMSMRSTSSSTGSYVSFSRNSATLDHQAAYTVSGFTLVSGFELLFLNGTVVNDQDYDIVGQTINNFPDQATGQLEIIQWTANNLGLPSGSVVNVLINTIISQSTYPFSFVPDAFNLYGNGVLLKYGTDFTTVPGAYTLTNTPTTVNNVLLQQTFARAGAA